MTGVVIQFPRTKSERIARVAAPFALDLAEKMAARGATRACLSIGLAVEGRRTAAAFGERGINAKLERLGRIVLSGPNPGRGRWVLVVTDDWCNWVSLAAMLRARGAN